MKCRTCGDDIMSPGTQRKYCSWRCYVSKWGSAEDRFWSNVDAYADEDGCWLWIGPADKGGYGLFSNFRFRGKREQRANRIAWILVKGAIPDGSWVLHRCDNPPCVNPDHLFLGNALANNRDMVKKGRQNYPSGEASNNAILTAPDVLKIRELHANGMTQRAIAKLFPVGFKTINKIVHRQRWRVLQ